MHVIVTWVRLSLHTWIKDKDTTWTLDICEINQIYTQTYSFGSQHSILVFKEEQLMNF